MASPLLESLEDSFTYLPEQICAQLIVLAHNPCGSGQQCNFSATESQDGKCSQAGSWVEERATTLRFLERLSHGEKSILVGPCVEVTARTYSQSLIDYRDPVLVHASLGHAPDAVKHKRLCCLTLELLDWDILRLEGQHGFHLSYAVAPSGHLALQHMEHLYTTKGSKKMLPAINQRQTEQLCSMLTKLILHRSADLPCTLINSRHNSDP